MDRRKGRRPASEKSRIWRAFADTIADPARRAEAYRIQDSRKLKSWYLAAASRLGLSTYGSSNPRLLDDLMRDVIKKVTTVYWGHLAPDWIDQIERGGEILLPGHEVLDPGATASQLRAQIKSFGLPAGKTDLTKAELLARAAPVVQGYQMIVAANEAATPEAAAAKQAEIAASSDPIIRAAAEAAEAERKSREAKAALRKALARQSEAQAAAAAPAVSAREIASVLREAAKIAPSPAVLAPSEAMEAATSRAAQLPVRTAVDRAKERRDKARQTRPESYHASSVRAARLIRALREGESTTDLDLPGDLVYRLQQRAEPTSEWERMMREALYESPTIPVSRQESDWLNATYSMSQYDPFFTYHGEFKRLHVSFKEVPPEPLTLAVIVNWIIGQALASNLHPESVETIASEGDNSLQAMFTAINRDSSAADDYDVIITLMGYAALTTYEHAARCTFEDQSYRADPARWFHMRPFNIKRVPLHTLVNTDYTSPAAVLPRQQLIEIARKWIEDAKDDAESMVQKSDKQADIETIMQLDVTFKFIPREASGYVLLKPDAEEKYRGRIFSPTTKINCFFECMTEYQRLTLANTGQDLNYTPTLEAAKRALCIGNSITTPQLREVVPRLSPQPYIIIHKSIGGSRPCFEWQKKLCTKIGSPKGPEIHLGYYMSHYFLIIDTSAVGPLGLQPSEFECFDGASTLKTKEEITMSPDQLKTAPVGAMDRSAWSLIPLSKIEETVATIAYLSRRVDLYWRQDVDAHRVAKDAARPVGYVVAPLILQIMKDAEYKCHYCGIELVNSNWTLDRVDSKLLHTIDNVVLACHSCNSRKGKQDYDDYVQLETRHKVEFDLETYPAPTEREGDTSRKHIIFNYSYVHRIDQPERASEEQWGDMLWKHCEKHSYYGQDAGERFVEEIKREDARLQGLLNARLEKYKKSLIRRQSAEEGFRCDDFYEDGDDGDDDDGKADDDGGAEKKEESEIDRKCNQRRLQLRRKMCEYWYAHNGGRYDIHFVLKSIGLEFSNVTYANGILQLTLKSGLIQFRDSMRMFSNTDSLASLCKAFELPLKYRKSIFPHAFMSREHLYYRGPVPPPEYWNDREVHPDFLDEHGRIKADAVYDAASECRKYNIMDTVSLSMVMSKYERLLRSQFKHLPLKLSDYLTLPSMTYCLGVSYMPSTVRVPVNRAISRFIRAAAQGGRVMPLIGRFTSKDWESIHKVAEDEALPEYVRQSLLHKLYDDCTDWITDADANSLYPSAMYRFKYPVGDPEWLADDKLEDLRAALNGATRATDVNEFPYLGVVECDLRYKPEALQHGAMTLPLIGEHNPRTGSLEYTLEPRHCIKTTVDLMQAVIYTGCEIVAIRRALIWRKRDYVFRVFIGILYELRRKYKLSAPAIAALAKLLMNAFFGKMMQRIIDEGWRIFSAHGGEPTRDKSKYHSTDYDQEDLDHLYRMNRVFSEEILANGQQALVHVASQKKTEKHPVQLGVLILSFSKVIMNEFIDAMDGFTNWDKTFYYTDTDSLHVHQRMYEQLKQRMPNAHGSGLCQLKDDIAEARHGKIIAARFVRPKVYCDEILGYDCAEYDAALKKVGFDEKKLTPEILARIKLVIVYHKRAKGVRKGSTNRLTLADFDSMLPSPELGYGSAMHQVVERRFRRAYREGSEPAIATVCLTKDLNRTPWIGRVFDAATSRFYPITPDSRASHDKQILEDRKRRREAKALEDKGEKLWKEKMAKVLEEIKQRHQ